MIQKTLAAARFNRLKKQFATNYATLQKLGDEPFVMPFWQHINELVVKSFEPEPSKSFLSNRAIIDTMFVDGSKEWLETQVAYLQNILGGSYDRTVKEDIIGSPRLLENTNTSHNTVHHLYHMHYYLEQTKTKPEDIQTVVEWGGGYGNFAKLWMRHINQSSTYVIIDTALFCSIQALYLGSVLGKSKVNLLASKDSKIAAGKINLVPSALLRHVPITGDLFVSTWGLSESLDEAQDFVVNGKWFGCDKLLIGFQDSTKDLKFASRLGKIAENDGARIIDIAFIPNNHYAFR